MIKYLFALTLSLMLTSNSLASTPLWTFTPLTPTTVSVSRSSVAEVQYLITNQSYRTHNLVIQRLPFTILSPDHFSCGESVVLGPQKSCILTISINGISLENSYREGPVFCEFGSRVLCYSPSENDILTVIYTH